MYILNSLLWLPGFAKSALQWDCTLRLHLHADWRVTLHYCVIIFVYVAAVYVYIASHVYVWNVYKCIVLF